MERRIRIYETPAQTAEDFAEELTVKLRLAAETGTVFTIALSGGSTPGLLYSILAEKYTVSVDWKFIHFFWGDERCVHPDDNESNYGMAYKKFLGRIEIPPVNIHRIKGEQAPYCEAPRYSDEIATNTRSREGLPVFDQIILGMGEDGHTASIFPSNRELLTSNNICEVAIHPVSRQKRITITGKVINNADAITFLVTGRSKSRTIGQIFRKEYDYPASEIQPSNGIVTWLLDKEAAAEIR